MRKMVVAPMFKKWLKTASKEDLEKLVQDGNDLAAVARVKSESGK